MISIFLFIIDVATKDMSTDTILTILGGVITLLILIIAFFLRSLYFDFRSLKKQVYENKEKIYENSLKDESDTEKVNIDFKAYKELMNEKNKHFEETLIKIDGTLKNLTTVTVDLKVTIAELKEKIKK